jgi:Flp pilus assembly protein TadD
MASRRRKGRNAHELSTGTPHPPAAVMPRGAIWRRAALIVLAGLLTYANALSGPFVLDDQDTILMNEQIRQLSPSVVLFPALELPVAGRPIVNVSFALNYAVGGLDVFGYHLVNVAIHLACALLLFGIVRRTLLLPALRQRFGTGAADVALAVALLWLVHPLQTDAVDYVTQRTELMMGFFYLLTFYAAIRAYESGRWLIVAVLACALGMGSKESMVTAPFLVLVYDRIFVIGTFKDAWQRRRRLYGPLAASWLVLAALISSGPRFRSAGFSSGVSPWMYLLNQTEMIVRYLRLAIWPRGLVVDYGVPQPMTLADAAPYGLVIVALIGVTVWALVRAPKLGFLGVWFFTTLAPTSSIVPIATEVGAERRMYLPLAAIVVIAVLAAAFVWQKFIGSRPDSAQVPGEPRERWFVPWAALGVVALALAAGTVARNREYSSAAALARTTVERWPTARAQHSLGIALVAAGQRDEGMQHLREAANGDPGAEYTLGAVLFKEGRLDEAMVHLREFLAHESTRLEVPAAHELIARILRTQGRYAEAVDELRTVLTMTPSNAEVHGLLGEMLFRLEKFDEAIPEYERFLMSRPDDLGARMQLGIALVAAGRQSEAIAQFRRIVELNPQDAGAQRNLARALVETGAYQEAVPFARQAAALRPDDPVAHDLLGMALAGQGNLDEGIAELRRALQLDPNDNEVRGHLQAALAAQAASSRRP